ncbi:hypothetical protein, partial [Enterobacter cloacae complex sp. 2DZ2F20B]|uniref:hypothetical protein n=1 Tax=Enterobacter cloacae complex sp. 2DZ2F20B TaxID=2511993 RepID=UPI001CA47847
RREVSAVMFLFKIVNYKIDCSELLAKIFFYVPRVNNRHSLPWHLSTARTNILVKSPINVMCSNFNNKLRDCDIF